MNNKKEKLIILENDVGSGVKSFSFLAVLSALLVWFTSMMPVLFTKLEASQFQQSYQNTFGFDLMHVPMSVIDLPYWLLQLNTVELLGSGSVARFIPVLLSMGGIFSFFILLKLWFGTKDALIGTTLLATNIGFLLAATSIQASLGYLVIVLCLGLIGVTQLSRGRSQAIVLVVLSMLLALYAGVYGWIFICILALALLRVTKLTKIQLNTGHRVSVIVMFLLALPFMIFLVRSYPQLWPWSEITTDSLLSNVEQIGRFVAIGANNPLTMPTQWGLLSFAEITLLLLGVLLLRRKFKANRYKIMSALLIGSVVVGVIHGVSIEFIGAFLPIAIIFIIGGVRYIRDSWHLILPRNKTGKTTAIAMVWIVIAVLLLLNVSRSFLFWGRISETQSQYSQDITLEF
ncbi:TPA: hypothetical protein EYO12_01240 [Candidatus Saccharibacteria bacterium]|nr:hypothetical protein [Candidatus Saccharibacteria bacterium]HIO87343.1 hypothetical protein [Candidatus Saccharibacteria bacterium]